MDDIISLIFSQNDITFYQETFFMSALYIILGVLGFFALTYLITFITTEYREYIKERIFKKYAPELKSRAMSLKIYDKNKEYIIIDEDFFDNVYTFVSDSYHKLSDAKLNFLKEKSKKFNIILYINKEGDLSNRIYNIVRYCKWNNLPICNIVGNIPKDYGIILNKDNDELIVYYRGNINE